MCTTLYYILVSTLKVEIQIVGLLAGVLFARAKIRERSQSWKAVKAYDYKEFFQVIRYLISGAKLEVQSWDFFGVIKEMTSVKLTFSPFERCNLCEFVVTSLWGIVFLVFESSCGGVAWIASVAHRKKKKKNVTNLFQLDSKSCIHVTLLSPCIT